MEKERNDSGNAKDSESIPYALLESMVERERKISGGEKESERG